MTNKQVVDSFFSTLWTDPEHARSLCTEDVTWITTRSMPIPGNEDSIEHVGFEAVLNVANSGKDLDVGYLPETMSHPHQLTLEAEDDHALADLGEALSTHPMMVRRIEQLRRYATSAQYRRLQALMGS